MKYRPNDSSDAVYPSTWSDARDQGLKYYFPGTICKNGHTSKRRVVGRACAECVASNSKTPQSIAKMKQWYAGKTHKQKMIGWAKYRHIYGTYGGEFELTEADLEWPEHCPALGIKLRYESQRSRNANDAPTIDRKDSSRGYVKGNVQILSRKANRIKNDGTPEEVMSVALFLAKDK